MSSDEERREIQAIGEQLRDLAALEGKRCICSIKHMNELALENLDDEHDMPQTSNDTVPKYLHWIKEYNGLLCFCFRYLVLIKINSI